MNTDELMARLTASVLIADGATGTSLQARGLPPGTAPETWVIDRSREIVELHRSFVDAGSDIILTCTFGGTPVRLAHAGLADRTAFVNLRAAELARTAAGEREGVLVAGSIGPTGQMLEPLGELTYTAAVGAFASQAAALAKGGVDLLVIETFYAIEEALAAIEGARRVCDLPIVCSFSYDRGTRTMMGVRPAQMAGALAPLNLAMLGVNCGRTLAENEQAMRELAASVGGAPIWYKPNAHLPQGASAGQALTPEELASSALRAVAAGARVVGGCCGSTAKHIAALARLQGFPTSINEAQ